MELESLAGFNSVCWTEQSKALLIKQLEPFFAFLPRTLGGMLNRQIKVHPAPKKKFLPGTETSDDAPSNREQEVLVPDRERREPNDSCGSSSRDDGDCVGQPDSPHGGASDAVGPEYRLSITLEGARIVAMAFGVELRDAYLFCMANGLWPLRFIRNAGTLTLQEQEYLLRSRVAVVGCGALGGYVSLLLARIGVGSLVLCDDDVFEETNLNRQLFCDETVLGQWKVEIARKKLLEVASHLLITTFTERATKDSLPHMLSGSHVLVDCVDTVAARVVMDEVAVFLGIPYIHGAVAGIEGFCGVSCVCEGPGLIQSMYGKDVGAGVDQGVLAEVGLFAPAPSLVASLQASFTIQTLLARCAGRSIPLKRLFHADLGVPCLRELEI